MKQVLGTVTANVALSPTTVLLQVRADDISRTALPGQFLHVRCGTARDPLLRRPLSITVVAAASLARYAAGADQAALALSDVLVPRPVGGSAGDPTARLIPDEPKCVLPGERELGLLVEAVGRGSAALCSARPGDTLDLLGPLGRPFVLHPKARRVLLVAGGIGIAPLVMLARAAIDRDVSVTMVFGARTAGRVFPPALVPDQVEYIVCTDDGTMGRAGTVISALGYYLAWADQLFACGPEPMLRALAREVRSSAGGVGHFRSRESRRSGANVPWAQVSLEQHMGCAMGACYGCAIETSAGRRRVCRDGPVFDLFEVQW